MSEKPKEYAAEYLGGSLKTSNNFENFLGKKYGIPKSVAKATTILKVTEDKLQLLACFPRSFRAVTGEAPMAEIPINSVKNVQAIPSENISAARAIVFGMLPAVIWKKKELLLTISFYDDSKMEQSLIFRMDKVSEAYQEVYNRVAAQRTSETSISEMAIHPQTNLTSTNTSEIQCGSCGTLNNLDAIFCKKCGNRFR